MNIKYYHGYAVREDGEIRGKRGGAMKQTQVRNGELIVTLYYDGSAHSMTVAKLVATLFVPNVVGDSAIVVHKDGDSFNNHKDNLEWRLRGANPLSCAVVCTLPDGTVEEYSSQNQAAKHLKLKSNRIIGNYLDGTMTDPRGGIWRRK